jgi:PilZ domain
LGSAQKDGVYIAELAGLEMNEGKKTSRTEAARGCADDPKVVKSYIALRGRDGAPEVERDSERQEALVSWGNGVTRARVVQGTSSVLLLEGERPLGGPLPPGAPLRVALPGAPHMVAGRLAAYGENGRYLISLGSRAVRGAARIRTDLRAMVHGTGLAPGLSAKIVDLSSSGARVQGHALPVGSDFDLRFVPPGRSELVSVRCVVVRAIADAIPAVGVAFCGGSLSFRVELTARPVAQMS